MFFFNNNYYEELTMPKIKIPKIKIPPKIKIEAPPKIKIEAPPKVAAPPTKKSLGTDYKKFPEGSAQRRFSYDNSLKSGKNPPKVLDNPSKVSKVSDDLNKIDNLDNIKKVDDIPNLGDDAKKIVKSSPEDIKADLSDAQKADFDTEGAKLLDEIKTPEFKSKTFKERLNSMGDWIKKNPKLAATIGGVTAVGTAFLGMYIKAQIDTNRINSTDYKITSITSDENDEVIVLYDPQDKFTLKDTIIISETNSVPLIDVSNVELTYVGNGVIKFSGEEITTNGTSGKLQCRTTAEDQFTQSVTDAAKPLTDIPLNIAGNILDRFIPPGLKDFFKNWWWVVLIICILVLSSSSAAIAFVYLK
jgi:hypothetical protein